MKFTPSSMLTPAMLTNLPFAFAVHFQACVSTTRKTDPRTFEALIVTEIFFARFASDVKSGIRTSICINLMILWRSLLSCDRSTETIHEASKSFRLPYYCT
jgi:hypothetical protein